MHAHVGEFITRLRRRYKIEDAYDLETASAMAYTSLIHGLEGNQLLVGIAEQTPQQFVPAFYAFGL